MEGNVQEFGQTATFRDFSKYRTDASRLAELCKVATKVKDVFVVQAGANEVQRLSGFIYEFPEGSPDFRLTVGPWRLHVRFVVLKTPVDADLGRRVFTGRYVFEVLPADPRELVGDAVFAVSFDDDGSVRLGDYRRSFALDFDVKRSPERLHELAATAEACVFDALYGKADRHPPG